MVVQNLTGSIKCIIYAYIFAKIDGLCHFLSARHIYAKSESWGEALSVVEGVV